jgi:putative restriction endonuclease
VSGFQDISAGFDFGRTDLDTTMRSAAFAHVRRLTQLNGALTPSDLAAGFMFGGERIPLVNPQRGIFKPRQMEQLLSIRTVFPKPGRKVWYDDQREVHRQFIASDESVDYAFMGTNPDAADNRWLRTAMEQRTAIIYFLELAPGSYQALIPTFIIGFDRTTLKARLAFGEPDAVGLLPETVAERLSYQLTTVVAPFRDCPSRG